MWSTWTLSMLAINAKFFLLCWTLNHNIIERPKYWQSGQIPLPTLQWFWSNKWIQDQRVLSPKTKECHCQRPTWLTLSRSCTSTEEWQAFCHRKLHCCQLQSPIWINPNKAYGSILVKSKVNCILTAARNQTNYVFESQSHKTYFNSGWSIINVNSSMQQK